MEHHSLFKVFVVYFSQMANPEMQCPHLLINRTSHAWAWVFKSVCATLKEKRHASLIQSKLWSVVIMGTKKFEIEQLCMPWHKSWWSCPCLIVWEHSYTNLHISFYMYFTSLIFMNWQVTTKTAKIGPLKISCYMVFQYTLIQTGVQCAFERI